MAFHDRRLGENLRRIRLNAHMTQKALTEQIGYQAPEHWSRIESGSRYIPRTCLTVFAGFWTYLTKKSSVEQRKRVSVATQNPGRPGAMKNGSGPSLSIVRRTSWKASCRSANKSRIFPGYESKWLEARAFERVQIYALVRPNL